MIIYHRYVFSSNRLSTVNILCIGQILNVKWEYIILVHQIITGFNKTYDSVLRAALYNILIETFITMNRKILTKLRLNGNYNKFQVSKNLFAIRNFFKNRDALSPFLYMFDLD
jgi:hypothetical protein